MTSRIHSRILKRSGIKIKIKNICHKASLFIYIASIFLFLSILFSSPAPAQSKSEDNVIKEAERLFLEGRTLAKRKMYRKALVKFRSSFRILYPPTTEKHKKIRYILHAFLGQTYQFLGQKLKARDHYRSYIKALPNGKLRGFVDKNLNKILPDIQVRLVLKTEPADANCKIQHPAGFLQGKSPVIIKVEAGKLKVSCQKEGFLEAQQLLETVPKKTAEVLVQLREEPKETRRTSPLQTKKQPSQKTDDFRFIAYIIGGVGLASIGTGAVLGFLSSRQHEEALEKKTKLNLTVEDTIEIKQTYNAAKQKQLFANVLYGVGGGLTVIGVALYFVLTPQAQQEKKQEKTTANTSRFSRRSLRNAYYKNRQKHAISKIFLKSSSSSSNHAFSVHIRLYP